MLKKAIEQCKSKIKIPWCIFSTYTKYFYLLTKNHIRDINWLIISSRDMVSLLLSVNLILFGCLLIITPMISFYDSEKTTLIITRLFTTNSVQNFWGYILTLIGMLGVVKVLWPCKPTAIIDLLINLTLASLYLFMFVLFVVLFLTSKDFSIAVILPIYSLLSLISLNVLFFTKGPDT